MRRVSSCWGRWLVVVVSLCAPACKGGEKVDWAARPSLDASLPKPAHLTPSRKDDKLGGDDGPAPTDRSELSPSCTDADLKGGIGFCYRTSVTDRGLVPEAGLKGQYSARFDPGTSTTFELELNTGGRQRAFFTELELPGPGYFVPGIMTIPTTFGGELADGLVESFCDHVVDVQFDVSEILFLRHGQIGRFSATLDGDCDSPRGSIFARVHIELEETDLITADANPCSVGGSTGYCWTSELGGYKFGLPRARATPEVEITAEYFSPRLSVRCINDTHMYNEPFMMGFAVSVGEELSAGKEYAATADYVSLDFQQVLMSVPTDLECDTKSGSFVVREFERSTVNPAVVAKLALDFDQVCEDRRLRGKVRLNSSVD